VTVRLLLYEEYEDDEDDVVVDVELSSPPQADNNKAATDKRVNCIFFEETIKPPINKRKTRKRTTK
jgi:hypothetical protein